MAEYAPRRLKSAIIKAEQLRATGAKIVITSCHNCVDGLFDLIKHYKLDIQVKQLVDLVANALVVPVPVEEEVVVAAAGDGRPRPARLLEGIKVLVIDDEPDVRTYLRMVFKDQGCEVEEAPDANQGMRAIKSDCPDIVTLDLIMPHKTGEKLYWELRKDERYATLPVVIISGYTRVDTPTMNFQKFLAEKNIPEPNAILEKPIDPEATIATLRKVLAEKVKADVKN